MQRPLTGEGLELLTLCTLRTLRTLRTLHALLTGEGLELLGDVVAGEREGDEGARGDRRVNPQLGRRADLQCSARNERNEHHVRSVRNGCGGCNGCNGGVQVWRPSFGRPTWPAQLGTRVAARAEQTK